MKKILSLLMLLVAIVTGAKADDVYKLQLNNVAKEIINDGTPSETLTYFDNTAAVDAGKFNFNNKYNGCTYDEVSYTKGLKMEGATAINFTNTTSATVIIVQSTSSGSDKTIKFDGSELVISAAATITGGRVYTIDNVAAGTHTVSRGSGESGLFAIYVTEKSTAPTDAPRIDNQPENVTYIIGSEEYPNMTVAATASKGVLKYQWQYMNPSTYEFADIPSLIIASAIESTIVGAQAIPILSAMDPGPGTFWIRCVVSDDNGSVTSNQAAIEVKNKSVATPVVTPADGAKFVESITMTATCETEGATISYLDGNEWKELTADGVTFTETTSTQVKAMLDGYDDSEIVYVTYTKAEITPLTPVSDATTWDFDKVTYSGSGDYELPDAEKTIEWTYVDFEPLTFATGFNATALAFKGQYPIRSNSKKFAQNGTLKFHASVPGSIKVHFTDTGTNPSSTATKRYLMVNGEETEYWTSRENNGDKPYPAQLDVETGDIPVEAGDVTIAGSAAICVSYVEFTPASEEVPVALINGDSYATYSYTKAVKLKEEFADDVKIYYGSSLTADALTLTEIEQKIIPAETGVVIAVDPNAGIDEVQFDLFEGADVPYIEINYLRPTTTANGKADPKKPTDGSPAALTLDGHTFKTFVGDEFNDYKAYISIDDLPLESNSLNIVFQDSETAVNAITEVNEAAEAPVKVVKNGQLYIGNYNVAGQQVK